MTKTNKKGTSLVELLAVIVIMGIIAAIAVPTVGALLKNTRQKAVCSDLTTLVQSTDTYVANLSTSELAEYKQSDNTYKITFTAGDLDAATLSSYADYMKEDVVLPEIKAGSITFNLNSTGSKVDSVTLSGDFKMEKNAKEYTVTGTNPDSFKAKEQ